MKRVKSNHKPKRGIKSKAKPKNNVSAKALPDTEGGFYIDFSSYSKWVDSVQMKKFNN